MNTFIANVKQWVILDKQLQYVNGKTRTLRNAKSEITKELCEYIQVQSNDRKVVEITDGELRFIEKREYTPLSFTYIQERLEEIIQNKDQVYKIIQYLKKNREVRVTSEIRRIEYSSVSSEEEPDTLPITNRI